MNSSQQPQQLSQVSSLPKRCLTFAEYLKQDQEIRAAFGVFVPLPVNISFARDKALAWVLNICENVHMSIRGLELLVFITDAYWTHNQALISRKDIQKHIICSFYLIFTEIEKQDLPLERIAWVCDEIYPLEDLHSHIEKLKQSFLEINSYVTASVLLQATGIALDEDEYKIAEIFFYQTYKEAICLDALGTLYVNMKFLSICCFFYSNAESIQAILGIIAGHVNPGQRGSLDAIAEEMNELAQQQHADSEDGQGEEEEEEQKLICCFNDEGRSKNEGAFTTASAAFTQFLTLNPQNHCSHSNNLVLQNIQHQQLIQSQNNNNNNNNMNPLLKDHNYPSSIESIQKQPYSSSSSPPLIPESACMGMEKPQSLLEQPMAIERLQNSSELMALSTNNNNNNVSYSELGVFSSSQQLNDLDLRTYHSNTTANSNYNSSNNNNNNNNLNANICHGCTGNNSSNNDCELLSKVQEVQEKGSQSLSLENNKQTLIQQLPTDFTIEGERMQEE